MWPEEAVNERMGSGEEPGVRHRGRSSRPSGSRRGDSPAEIKQLLQGLLITFISVGMLFGGFLLSQLDTPDKRPSPTQEIAGRPTLTPFLPTFTPQPSATVPSTEKHRVIPKK